MKKLRRITERRFTIELLPARKTSLPEAKLIYSIDYGEGLKPEVQSAYFSLPSIGEVAEESKSFDDGLVTVDYDNAGRLIGVEFLNQVRKDDIPKLLHHAKVARQEIIVSIVNCTMHYWEMILAGALIWHSNMKNPAPPEMNATMRGNWEKVALTRDTLALA